MAWIKNVRRHKDQLEIVELFESLVDAKKVSKRQLAKWVGVNDKTLRRWLAGEDFPDGKIVSKAIGAAFVPAHPTGTSEWTRNAAYWANNTVPYGGETDKFFYGSIFDYE